MDEPFGMGHQPQHAASWITQPRDARHRPVRIVIRIVGDRDLPAGFPIRQNSLGTDRNPSLRMRHRQFQFSDSLQEHRRGVGRNLQFDPPAGVPAVFVPGEGRVGLGFGTGRPGFTPTGQDPRPHQHLESIADPQHQLVGREELLDGLGEMRPQLGSEDHPGSDVVAVAEPPRHTQDLIVPQQFRTLEDAEQMDPVTLATAVVEDPAGLHVTVGPGSTQH